MKAKGLLSQMLSLPENWDYTLKGLTFINSDGIDAIREAVRELERAGYIVRTRARNAKGQLAGSEYVIYEQPHPPDAPPASEKPALDKPTLENPTQEKPTQENPTTYKDTNKLKTNISITEQSNPYPSNPKTGGIANTSPRCDTRCDEMGYEKAKEIIQENIEYELLAEKYSHKRLDEAVDLMAETLCSRKQSVVIAGDEYPVSFVRDRLLKVNDQHIGYVFECLDKNTTYVRNIKKYLLAALFNAPSTIDSYYSALVQHDLYGDGQRGK